MSRASRAVPRARIPDGRGRSSRTRTRSVAAQASASSSPDDRNPAAMTGARRSSSNQAALVAATSPIVRQRAGPGQRQPAEQGGPIRWRRRRAGPRRGRREPGLGPGPDGRGDRVRVAVHAGRLGDGPQERRRGAPPAHRCQSGSTGRRGRPRHGHRRTARGAGAWTGSSCRSRERSVERRHARRRPAGRPAAATGRPSRRRARGTPRRRGPGRRPAGAGRPRSQSSRHERRYSRPVRASRKATNVAGSSGRPSPSASERRTRRLAPLGPLRAYGGGVADRPGRRGEAQVVEDERAGRSGAVGVGQDVLVDRSVVADQVVEQEVVGLGEPGPPMEEREELALVAFDEPLDPAARRASPAGTPSRTSR